MAGSAPPRYQDVPRLFVEGDSVKVWEFPCSKPVLNCPGKFLCVRRGKYAKGWLIRASTRPFTQLSEQFLKFDLLLNQSDRLPYLLSLIPPKAKSSDDLSEAWGEILFKFSICFLELIISLSLLIRQLLRFSLHVYSCYF